MNKILAFEYFGSLPRTTAREPAAQAARVALAYGTFTPVTISEANSESADSHGSAPLAQWRHADPWLTAVALALGSAAVVIGIAHWTTGYPKDWATSAGSLAGAAAAFAGVALYRATLGLVAEATRGTKATRELAKAAADGVEAARDLIQATESATRVAEEAAWLTAHELLRPRFEVTSGVSDGGTGDPYLIVRLVGPDALERLDEMHVSVLDNEAEHNRPEIAGTTIQERRNWLWSGFRFATMSGDPQMVIADDLSGRNAKPQVDGITRADMTVYALAVNEDPRPSALRHNPEWREAVSQTRLKIVITSLLRRHGTRDHMWTSYAEVMLSEWAA